MIKTAIIAILVASTSFAQNKVDKRVIDDACACVNNVNVNLPTKAKNDSIHSCIVMANIKAQILDDMTGKLKKQALSGAKDSVSVITAEKDIDLIQETLLTDCPFMRELLMTDNQKSDKSISKNGKAFDFHQKGSQYFNEQKYELAVVEFKKAVKIDPTFAFAWDDLGLSYRRLNNYREAIKCYQKSIELDPVGKTPLMNMAVAYHLLKDNKNAITTYKKFIELHPEDAEGYYGIARIYNFEKEYENALENALKAVEAYEEINSPYVQDGINVMREIVSNLKKENKIKIFNDFAEKHGLKKIDE